MCLQHLVKDQRVLKLVQRLAAREEEREAGSTQQNSDDWDELTAYVSTCIILYMYRQYIHMYMYSVDVCIQYIHIYMYMYM